MTNRHDSSTGECNLASLKERENTEKREKGKKHPLSNFHFFTCLSSFFPLNPTPFPPSISVHHHFCFQAENDHSPPKSHVHISFFSETLVSTHESDSVAGFGCFPPLDEVSSIFRDKLRSPASKNKLKKRQTSVLAHVHTSNLTDTKHTFKHNVNPRVC